MTTKNNKEETAKKIAVAIKSVESICLELGFLYGKKEHTTDAATLKQYDYLKRDLCNKLNKQIRIISAGLKKFLETK